MDNKRILILNTKGGCGKSTLTTNLASYYASRGMTTALLDFDTQGSSMHWLKQRPKSAAQITGIAASNQKQCVTRTWYLHVPHTVRRTIIDTPGSMDLASIKDHIQEVDCVLVPVLSSPIDIAAVADFVRDMMLKLKIHRRGIKFALVSNRVKANTIALQSLNKFLRALDIPVIGQFRDTQLYADAGEKGLGIHELPAVRAKADKDAWHQLVNNIEILLGEKPLVPQLKLVV